MKLLLLSFAMMSLFADSYIPKYISRLGLAEICDISPFHEGFPNGYPTVSCEEYSSFFCGPYPPFLRPENYIKNVKDGDVIFILPFYFVDFVKNVFPTIHAHFVLVVAEGDYGFPSLQSNQVDINNFLDDERIIHVFAENIDGTISHEKLSHFPTGLDFHSMTSKYGSFGHSQRSVEQQETTIDNILGTLPATSQRKKRALIDFHFSDVHNYGNLSRCQIAEKIISSGIVDKLEYRVPRYTLYQMKGEYAFSISVPGIGLGCHRTWEDLLLGCIVIVETSSLDPLYEGLPVVIIKEWDEINEENFERWLRQYGDVFSNPEYREKLMLRYWANKIFGLAGRMAPNF